jgi:hypothetical protein
MTDRQIMQNQPSDYADVKPLIYAGLEPPLYLVTAPHKDKTITSSLGHYNFLYADYGGGLGETGYTYQAKNGIHILMILDHHTQGICCDILLPGLSAPAFVVNYNAGKSPQCSRIIPHEQRLPLDYPDKTDFSFSDGTTVNRCHRKKRISEIHFQFVDQKLDLTFQPDKVIQCMTMSNGYFEKMRLINGFADFQSGCEEKKNYQMHLNLCR